MEISKFLMALLLRIGGGLSGESASRVCQLVLKVLAETVRFIYLPNVYKMGCRLGNSHLPNSLYDSSFLHHRRVLGSFRLACYGVLENKDFRQITSIFQSSFFILLAIMSPLSHLIVN